jgi:hypothetical protein
MVLTASIPKMMAPGTNKVSNPSLGIQKASKRHIIGGRRAKPED